MMDKKYCVSTQYQGALHEDHPAFREYQVRNTLLSGSTK